MLERRGFQFRLSTAVLAMLVGGALLGLNSVEMGQEGIRRYSCCGWPLHYHFKNLDQRRANDEWYQWDAFAMDVVAAISLLAATVLAAESRRRFKRTEPGQRGHRLHAFTVILLLAVLNFLLWANICWEPCLGDYLRMYPFYPVGFPWRAYVHCRGQGHWDWGGLAMNVACAVGAFLVVAIISESVLRLFVLFRHSRRFSSLGTPP